MTQLAQLRRIKSDTINALIENANERERLEIALNGVEMEFDSHVARAFANSEY